MRQKSAQREEEHARPYCRGKTLAAEAGGAGGGQASNERVYAKRPSATAAEDRAGARTEQPATATIRPSTTALIRAVTCAQPRWPGPQAHLGL